MVDLSALGFPSGAAARDQPRRNGGHVSAFWYRLGDPSSVHALAPPPTGLRLENSPP